jgi:predicted dehydrogenase
MPTKYRVGIIGHTGRGNYGHGIDTVWAHFKDRCEVVAVADADEKGRAEAVKRVQAPKAYADYRQMLDEAKPQIVAICPRWLDQHRDMVVAAAERGMHIYMEKPFCRTLAEADQMVAACEKKDMKLAIAHQTRYSPRLQAVREIIDSGQLGTLLELRGRGKEDQRGGGEDLWVLGSHVMNLIHFCGGQPTWCFARVEQDGKSVTKAHVKPGNEGIGPLAGDHVVATYGLESGTTGFFGSQRAAGARGEGRFGLQIYGSKGVLEILTGHLPSVQFLADPLWSPGRSQAKWVPVTSAGIGQPEPLKEGGLDAGNLLAVKDLLSAIDNDRQPECNIHEARTTVEMIAAVFESHRLSAPVTFPLKTRENPLTLL